MPTRPHEIPISLFRENPQELFSLLQKRLPQQLVPTFDEIRAEDANFTQLDPVEYRADLVLGLRQKGVEAAAMAIVLEVQLREDPNKHNAWPLYVAALLARLKCPTFLIVVCLEEGVAKWAAQPIANYHGGCFAPIVLGPEQIPKVLDPEVAKRSPNLAMLSFLSHRKSPEVLDIAKAAVQSFALLEDEGRQKILVDTILSLLDNQRRTILEAHIMDARNYEYQSDFAKRYVAQGQLEGKVGALLRLLANRKIALGKEQQEKIQKCTDLELLDRWLDRVLEVSTADEIFAG